MKIGELFKRGKPVYSFEIFPPKKDGRLEHLEETLAGLTELKPDFISVTCGAGGSSAQIDGALSTNSIARLIKDKYRTESISHLTCINSTRSDIDRAVEELKQYGIENILALRGDRNPDIEPKEDFRHADELITYLAERGDFDIAGACYPETHLEANSPEEDIENLKRKVDAGAGHLISQLFYDNDNFYRFLEKARAAGINVPIVAGIMPCTNAKQIERMVTMCGASLPTRFTRMIGKYGSDPIAMRDAGISYAASQIIDLAANDVDGIHLYTMNNPYIARKITESVENILR